MTEKATAVPEGEANSLHRPTIAIVGRPNVGKSSLFNAILNRRLAIVHEMSGVTRDRISAPVFRNGRRFNLVDTGGLGMLTGETRKVDFWDANIAQQVEAAVADADVLIMVGDAQAGVTPLERDIAVRLRASGRPAFWGSTYSRYTPGATSTSSPGRTACAASPMCRKGLS